MLLAGKCWDCVKRHFYLEVYSYYTVSWWPLLFVTVQAFFRRSLRNKLEYRCVGGGDDCVIEPGKRSACSACRLKKCLRVGMSTAGLYKMLCTVKSFKAQSENVVTDSNIGVQQCTVDCSNWLIVCLCLLNNTLVVSSVYFVLRTMWSGRWFVAAIKTGRYTHAKKAKDITEVKLLLAQQQEQQRARAESCQDSRDSVASPISTELTSVQAGMINEGLRVGSPLAVDDLEKIIEHITNVHLSQTPITPDFVAALPEREKRYMVRNIL